MPYVGSDFLNVAPNELRRFSLDFVNDLPDGVTISSATWNCSVASDSVGADLLASTRLSTDQAIISGSKTRQSMTGTQIEGVKYVLTAIVVTSDGQTLKLWSHTKCVSPH